MLAARRDESMSGMLSAVAPQSSEIDFAQQSVTMQRNSFKQSKQFAQQEFVKFR